MPPGEVYGPVQGHDRLARARGTRHAGRPRKLPLDDLALGRVQKDRPLLPREVEGPFELVLVGHDPEATLGVRVLEGVGLGRSMHRHGRRVPRCQLEQSLGGLGRQVVGQLEHRVLRGSLHVGHPLCRDTVAQEVVLGHVLEERPSGGLARRRNGLGLHRHIDIARNRDLAHRLAHLDELSSARLRMALQLAALGPRVGVVVVVDVTQQEARVGLVHDDPDVAAHAHRPEVFVFRPVELVELEPRMSRVHLQVEGRGLHGLLIVVGQLVQAARERVRDPEFHQSTL